MQKGPFSKGRISKDHLLSVVDLEGAAHALPVRCGRTLLEHFVDNSVEISHSCGGMGTCGTCRVFLDVRQGETPEKSELEIERGDERGFTQNERLSCQLTLPDEPCEWRVLIPEPTS